MAFSTAYNRNSLFILLMYLLDYLRIFIRWWWLIVLPAVVIGAFGWLTYRAPVTTYSTTLRFTASAPPQGDGKQYDPYQYAWTTSEYITAGLSDWVKTGQFATLVSADLAERGVEIAPAAVQGAIFSEYERSQMRLHLNGGNPEQLAEIASSAINVLQTKNNQAFPQHDGLVVQVVALDQANIGAVPGGVRQKMDLLIRLGLGTLVGVGLALLAHYFDPFVRSGKELQSLGLPASVNIPRKGK